jgi:hypothetical protein
MWTGSAARILIPTKARMSAIVSSRWRRAADEELDDGE